MIIFYIILCLCTCINGHDDTDSEDTTFGSFEDSDEVPPKILKGNTEVTAVLGSSISLYCKIIEGDEPITVYWEFTSAVTGDQQSLDDEGPKLTIQRVQRAHAGKYTCTAQNNAGIDEHIIALAVKDGLVRPPKILKKQKIIETELGNQLFFSCRLTEGSRDTKIRWMYRHTVSDNFRKISPPIVKNSFMINKFIINSVKPKDLGFYKCIAENRDGRDEHTFEVIVKDAVSEPPKIDKKIKTVYGTKGYPITLNCKVFGGDPATIIQWQYRKHNPNIYINLKTKGPSFMIMKVTEDNRGFYKCIANNEAGSDTHIIQLIVQGVSELKEKQSKGGNFNDYGLDPPRINKYTTHVRRGVDEPVALFCNVLFGKEGTTIRWQFKKSYTNKFLDLPSTKTPLIIEFLQVEDGGIYRCIAENEGGYDKLDIELVILEKLDFPYSKQKINGKLLKDENNKTMSETENSNYITPIKGAFEGNKNKEVKLTGRLLPPVILPYADTVRRSIGYPVALFCTVQYDREDTSISWQFKAHNKKKFTDLLTEKSPLIIEYLDINDTGTYRCIAKNDAGYDMMDIKLTVIEPMNDIEKQVEDLKGLSPITLDIPFAKVKTGRELLNDENKVLGSKTKESTTIKQPKIDKSVKKVKSAVGMPMALNCKIISGDPGIKLKWQFHNYQQKKFHDLKFHSTPYMIPSVGLANGGFYRCVAENLGGNDSHVLELVVTDFMNTQWAQLRARYNDQGELINDLTEEPEIVNQFDRKMNKTVNCILANNPERNSTKNL